jgi:hypothetical protein
VLQTLPAASSFIKWMFFLIRSCTKSVVVCVHPRFFVTFRHGTHGALKVGDKLKIYKANEPVEDYNGIDVSVAQINERFDFILLKSPIGVNVVEVRS